MKQRVLTAAIGAPLLLLLLLLAPSWGTLALVCAMSGGACWELLRAVGPKEYKGCVLLVPAAVASPLILAVVPGTLPIAAWVMLWTVYAFACAVFRYGKPEKQLHFATIMAGLLGVFLVPAAFTTIFFLREMGNALVLLPLCCAFGSDTVALFAGMLFGKHKLAPHVSPKKTIEGSLGGFVGSLFLVAVYAVFVHFAFQMHVSVPAVIALGLLGSFMGQLGDLSFSVIKREFGVKDYSKLLPGHGGVLDRFDSVAFVAPVVWLVARTML